MISDFEKVKGMTYQEAKEYLISINKWQDVQYLSGYEIVDYACELKNSL